MNKKAELDVAYLKLPLYFETFDNIINCIEDRFNQTDYQIDVHLQEILIKAL